MNGNFILLSQTLKTELYLKWYFRVLVGAKFFSPTRRPDRFWGPTIILPNEYGGLFHRGYSSRGMNLTTHFQLLLRTRIRVYIHALPPMSSWRCA
jgi:hypothetical protein